MKKVIWFIRLYQSILAVCFMLAPLPPESRSVDLQEIYLKACFLTKS